MQDQTIEQPKSDERPLPWYNKLTLSEEFYKENFPYDLNKIKDLFGSFHPNYPIKGFLFGYDDDNRLSCYVFYQDDGVVTEIFSKGIAEKYPNLLRFALKKALNRHALLNSHMKHNPHPLKLHMGYTNDDFVMNRMRIQFKYKF